MDREHGQLIHMGSHFTAIRLMQEERRTRTAGAPQPKHVPGERPPRPDHRLRSAEEPHPAVFHPLDGQIYVPGTPEHAALVCHCCWRNVQEQGTLCAACSRAAPGIPACIHGGEPTLKPHDAWECPVLASARKRSRENNA